MSLISPALLYFGMNEKVFQKVIMYNDIINYIINAIYYFAIMQNIIIYNF